MLPDKCEKQARDDCEIDNDNSLLVPHFTARSALPFPPDKDFLYFSDTF